MLSNADALRGANVLALLREGFEPWIEDAYRVHFPGRVRVVAVPIPESPADLRCAIAVREDGIIDIFVAGIETQAQAELVIRGYAAVLPGSGRSEPNDFFYAVASDLIRAMTLLRNFEGARVHRFWGHSAGGGVCEVAAKYFPYNNLIVHSICTFGAPKPGAPGATNEEGHVHRNRYMHYNDYVPMVPHANLPASGGRSIALSWIYRNAAPWRCVHGSGGLLLRSSYATPAREAAGDRSPLAGLDSWVAGRLTERDAHSMDNYRAALRAVVDRENEEATANPAGLVAGQLAMGNALVDGPDLVLELAARAPASQPGIGLVLPIDIPIPGGDVLPGPAFITPRGVERPGGFFVAATLEGGRMAQAKLRGRLRMKYVKAGTNWVVVWNDFLIATFTRPSSAKTFCSAGNRFLRLMRNNGALYMPVFVDAFTSFIGVAAGGDPDYQPPLIVNP